MNDKDDYEIFEETIHEINPHAEVMYTEDSNKLRLHHDHKEDLKEVLQAMMQITINLQKTNAPPKPQGFLFRLLNKTTR